MLRGLVENMMFAAERSRPAIVGLLANASGEFAMERRCRTKMRCMNSALLSADCAGKSSDPF
jgi:hypothetical protein